MRSSRLSQRPRKGYSVTEALGPFAVLPLLLCGAVSRRSLGGGTSGSGRKGKKRRAREVPSAESHISLFGFSLLPNARLPGGTGHFFACRGIKKGIGLGLAIPCTPARRAGAPHHICARAIRIRKIFVDQARLGISEKSRKLNLSEPVWRDVLRPSRRVLGRTPGVFSRFASSTAPPALRLRESRARELLHSPGAERFRVQGSFGHSMALRPLCLGYIPARKTGSQVASCTERRKGANSLARSGRPIGCPRPRPERCAPVRPATDGGR